MKLFKLLLGSLVFICATAAISQTLIDDDGTEEETGPSIEERGCGYTRPMVVATMVGNPPFGWVERHDERTTKDLESYGLGRKILDIVSKKLGISYVSTGFLSYSAALSALKKGEIDLLLASYYHPMDGTTFLYPGYFTNSFAVYFKKGNEFPVNDIRDLEGLLGIVRREEQIYPLIQRHLTRGILLTQVSSAKKAFEMLMNGEADYLIGSPYSEEAELRRYKLNFDIVRTSKAIDSSNLFFVFSSNSDCWKLSASFSKALKKYAPPATINKMVMELIDDWGERFRNEPGIIIEKEEESEE